MTRLPQPVQAAVEGLVAAVLAEDTTRTVVVFITTEETVQTFGAGCICPSCLEGTAKALAKMKGRVAHGDANTTTAVRQ